MQNVRIKEKSIREHTGEQSLALGREYAQRRAIFDTKQQGAVIKARCEGSRPEPYRLWARLDPSGNIVESGCNCPVGGRCKHVAALLLCWRSQPEEFLRLVPIPEWLTSRTHQELQELILKMLSREPSLEELFEIPVPQREERLLSEIEATRRQVNALFRRLAHHHDAATAQGLQVFFAGAQTSLSKESPRAAASVLIPLVGEILQHHEEDLDEHPTLLELVAQCVTSLSVVLQQSGDEELRTLVLQTLLDVYLFDIEAGGITVGDEVPGILSRTLQDWESRWVSERLREALAGAHDWGRSELGGLLLSLERERLDDASFLLLCQETGRAFEQASRLLQLSRDGEIVDVIFAASEDDALRIAEMLVTEHHAPLAEKALRERERRKPSERVSSWLAQRSALSGDAGDALEMIVERLLLKPSLDTYREIKGAAPAAVLEQAMRRLREKSPDLLRQIFIEEGDLLAAIAILPPMKSSDFLDCYPHLLTAEAAEKTLPNEAVEIYLRYASLHQAQQGLSSCKEACRILAKVKRLLLAQEKLTRWSEIFEEQRAGWRDEASFEAEAAAAGLL